MSEWCECDKIFILVKKSSKYANETEVSAADKLFSFRNLNDLFHSISFDTISAIGNMLLFLIIDMIKTILSHL